MKKGEQKISWAKDLSHLSKEQFVEIHKDAYPNVDLAKEYDEHVKPKAEVKTK